ncbi:MAG: efflux RND transporter permease subunit, partial [Leptospiraceae bacterium]|nr:efflux RND transporter permease subunit [Leptospiraceae bacterium]
MLNLLIEKFLENRITVLFFFLVFVIFGLFAVKQLPIDAIPDITPTQVMVNTKTGALDPEQIEKTVTYYIETEMAGIPKVRDVRSLSRFGLSQVVIVFEEGTDIYWARQLVLERIQNIKDKLPGGLNPELGPISTGLGEIVLFSVDAKKDTELWKKPEKERLIYLRTITDFVVRPFLKSHIPNIADIDVTGGYKKQVHIDIQPEKMIQYGLTFHEVIAKVESLGDNFGGGYIQNEGKQIIVRTNGLINNLEAIRKLPVKLNFYGKAIQLGDIALIREDHMERVGAAILEGKETVVGTVFMLLGANSREVSQNAVKAIHEIPLPSDVQIRVVYDRSFLVDATIKTVINNLSEGAILVIIVLLMVLGNFRAAIIVSLAIPICMVFALTAMKHLNISANLLSLGAIDFGLLVDGSVVVVENIIRKLQIAKRTESQTSSFQIILEACKEVVQPVTFGLVIVMVVYIPILSLEGIEGKMFKPMAVSVFMALIASLIVALFIMPIFSFFLLKRDKMSHKDSFVFHYVQKGFSPLLNFALKFKILVLTIAFLFGSLCLFLYMRMGSDFIPPLDEGDMSIGFVRDPNIGIDESLRQQKLIETTISKIPE